MAINYPYKSPFMLFPNEVMIFATNPHWLLLIAPVFTFAFLWFVYLFIICPFVVASMLSRVCLIVSALGFASVITLYYLEWKFNRLYLTNYRLVKEQGIIGKRFMSIFLEQVQDITCSYGIAGRIFHFGDLEIESAGTSGRMIFKGMPSPKGIKWLVERQIMKLMK